MSERVVTLSLISHTNVGKTTLARTLLKRDVGEVRDQEHVTDKSEVHTLIESGECALRLWDTPGFGDTARLVRRLRRERDPLGWFLHSVWDRVANRPMWCSQEAVRNVRDAADLVLYLVNAAEDPEDAGYVPLELEVLAWMRRPVLVLLNQVGRDAEEAVERWRSLSARHDLVRDVLPLDAFTRCWTEEGVLLARVEALLGPSRRDAMRELRRAWNRENLAVFRQSCDMMADYLVRAAGDRERPGSGRDDRDRGSLARILETVRFGSLDKRQAMKALARKLDVATSELMQRLIEAHGLEGASAERIERSLLEFEVADGGWPLDEKSGALLGGALSGALGGLAADALSGGLSLGGGLIAGTLLGALGGAALGRGYRWVGGDRAPSIRWSAAFLDRLCRQAILRYLAVAHFGRGRGAYRDLERPERFREDVDAALERRAPTLRKVWEAAERGDEDAGARLAPLLREVVRSALVRAHPNAASLFSEASPNERTSD